MTGNKTSQALQLHPELLRRYRLAWKAWVETPALEGACEVLGMTPFEWAKRYVGHFGPITVTASDTSPRWSFDGAWAWEEARHPVAVPDA